ncbi:MAG: Glycosyl phosphatidyl inositol protein transamidase complex subunit [Alectoria sarmentosa]|nr:MAG: Glycosyl phosphatidyl inositol protein transamidase complex subunit [Alectoria sarmentosa]
MAPTLPQFNPARLRTYVFRIPLFTRVVLLLVILFWILEFQTAWDVAQWGALVPLEVNLGTMYRLNTYPLIHLGFLHALLNTLALAPLLERFEADHGTLLTAAMFVGPAYLLIERGLLRGNTAVMGARCDAKAILRAGETIDLGTDTIHSVWVFVLLGAEGIKAFRANPFFAIGTKAPTLSALRRDPRLLKLPPYLSALCVFIGVVWLCLLPLNEYSRHTYISENALLPGQVHTYFGGSEQNVFNAYKYEVQALLGKDQEAISKKLSDIFESAGLRPARQKYDYHAAGNTYSGENVYAILHAPRGDATEAIVLVAAWTNMDGNLNQSGVALALALAKYFKRWSLWSKDIIILITGDSRAGPQAWVDAYHDEHTPPFVAPLALKSGALQGVVVVDNALDHRFESLHIVYDGINGQLPNLDLFNTAVSIASGQLGIGVSLQRMWKHNDSYQERLQTMLRGMVSQGLGYSSGPHSSFVPYHVDAITLQAVGDGWQDEMAMGRCVESIFRSLNNLLEHFHQSFFFYLLMQADRFVSIGTYLPSAMLVAVNFTIMAIALWIRSGRPPAPKVASTMPEKQNPEMEIVQENNMTAITPKENPTILERQLFLPVTLVVSLHFLGVIPLYVFINSSHNTLPLYFLLFTFLNFLQPTVLATFIHRHTPLTPQHHLLLQSFSLLILGIFLATLATLNFSLSLFVGLLSTPLSFTGNPFSSSVDANDVIPSKTRQHIWSLVLQLLSPPVVVWAVCYIWGADLGEMLAEAAFGWKVNGLWTQVVIWCVWWPAWTVGGVLVNPLL